MVVLHLPEPSLCGDINESVRAAGRDAGTAAEDTVTVFHAFNMHLDSAPKKATFFKVLILVHNSKLLVGSALVQFSEQFHSPVRRRDSGQDEDALIGCALHQHKLHLSEVYGLRRDQAGRILLKNDGLVFHEGE
jgi:hypothetical protein